MDLRNTDSPVATAVVTITHILVNMADISKTLKRGLQMIGGRVASTDLPTNAPLLTPIVILVETAMKITRDIFPATLGLALKEELVRIIIKVTGFMM